MLMTMLVVLALTLMLLLDALKTSAYAGAYNADADASMPNVAFHLAGALLCC